MQSIKTRRLPALLAVAVTAGITVTALAATASAATGGTARTGAACDEAAGKYKGHVITSYDITGGNDSTQGVPGGTPPGLGVREVPDAVDQDREAPRLHR